MKPIAYATILLILFAMQAEASRVVALSFLPMMIDPEALRQFHASGIYYSRMQTARQVCIKLIMASR